VTNTATHNTGASLNLNGLSGVLTELLGKFQTVELLNLDRLS
jgi:hypothetical protein